MSRDQNPAHQVSIKNLKFSEFASRETHCFEVSVYINGVRKGVAGNDGQGGPNHYFPQALYADLNAIAKTLPPCDMTRHGIAEPLAQNPDILIADLVEAEVIRKKIARMVASRTWFRKPGHQYQPAEWSCLTAKTSPETIAFVQKKYGVETVILGHNRSTLD